MFNSKTIQRVIGLPTLAIAATLALSLVNLPTHQAQAQSTDRDRPTLIQSSEIKGSLKSQSDFFYSFTAKPGDLKVTIDLKPSSGSIAVAALQFYDETGRELLPVALMPTANSQGGDRKVTSLQIQSRQKILMRVTDGTGYGGNYTIRLDGAIDLNKPSTDQQLKLPSTGKLRVELKDGSVHEFDLRNINQAIIQP
jgi:hypothetical protein